MFGAPFSGTFLMYLLISMIIAPVLETKTIKMNWTNVKGAMPKIRANGEIKIEAVITARESSTAVTRYLFLKMPTFSTG